MGRAKTKSRHQDRSPTPSTSRRDDHDHRRRSRRDSRSTTASLDRLTEALTSIIEKNNSRPSGIERKGDAVPVFNPEDRHQSSEAWCKKIDELMEIFRWPEEATIYFAVSKLRGLAEVWYKSLGSVKYSWPEWKIKLLQAFPPTGDFYENLVEMIRRRKKHEESYLKYYYEKLALLNTCGISGEKAVSCIVGGMDDRVAKTGAKASCFKSPEELLNYLSRLNEPVLAAFKPHSQRGSLKVKPYERFEKRSQGTSTNILCYKCGKQGHFANKCSSTEIFDVRCGVCRSYHHKEKNCPKRPRADSSKMVALLETPAPDKANEKYYQEIKINGHTTQAYIDFGSSCTIITWSEARRLELAVCTQERVTLRGYGNGSTCSRGSTKIEIEVDQVTAVVEAVVVSDSEQNIPVIVGRTFTELPHVIVIKSGESLRFLERDGEQDLLSACKLETPIRKIILRATDTYIIPPKHQNTITLKSDEYSGIAYLEASLRPQEGRESCLPRGIFSINEKKEISVPITNLSDADIVLKANKIVARAWPCDESAMSNENIFRIETKNTPDLKAEDINVGQIDDETRRQLLDLLQEYRDCISINIDEIGCAESVQMKIRLQEDKPFSFRPYRMARHEQDVVNDIVNDLLTNNIIRESNSEYASPIVLVKKKNGESRLCVDFRKLNSVTIKDNHPLPRIDDQIDRLHGGIFFTSLDLRSGYHQIPMEEESKRYTAFVTPAGQYEFERMPFGLTNAPRLFQRLMNRILRPVGDIASVYLDDVLLHANTIPRALDGLRNVLEIFRKEGLTLNLKKCSFLMTSVTFLGYTISNGKVQPGSEKTKAVADFETPKTVQNIRQFLGLTGYFRHFVKDYGTIARPLTSLIRKNCAWKWTEVEDDAFRKLKSILVDRPVLALFNPNAITEVHTDASSLGVAGILLQYQQDSRLHPVAYFSRQTTDLESKFHSYELETLAVVESLKKFRSYLFGSEFTVVTDCNALKATKNKKELIPRIARWWLQIQEFCFKVIYRPGTRMKHVDALSRNPVAEHIVMQISQADWVLAGQLTDEKIQEIHKVLMKPPKTDYERSVYKNYALREGRIYRITARGIQWVVPRGMRNQVVKAAHDDLGHFSVEKTLYRLCENYWFPRMRQYVEKFSPTRAPSPWDGVRLADRFSAVCPQRLPNIQNETVALEKMPRGRLEFLKRLLPLLQDQSEDCLYLNIFSPIHAATSEKKLPVIVFLHGESFEWNSGNTYDGSVLAGYGDIVVVTLNYRLGILGFLNANPSPHIRARVANYGLMDQMAALHWVQQNIMKFGGDPNMVTLAGHGTGAACINFLMTSPTMVPGLFHRAILLSGSAYSSWAIVEDPVIYALKLAKEVNCSIPEDLIKNHEQIVDCLRDVALEELQSADIQAPNFLTAFGPSIDGVVIRSGHTNQETDEPMNRNTKRSQENSGRYDVLFGVVTGEAIWRFSAADIQNGFEGERRDRIIRTYVRNAYSYHLNEIFFTIVNEYTDWDRTSQHPINTRDTAVAALSDAQYIAPLVRTGDMLAQPPAASASTTQDVKTGPKCYFYVFDYQTKDGDYPQRMGTVHGEDLPYIFGAPLVEGFSHFPNNYTKSEVALSEAVMIYWSNFARTGNPNEPHRQDTMLPASKERSRFRSIAWEEYDSLHQKYLEIGMKPRIKNHFRAHQLSIWLRLIPELHRAGMEDVIARHNLFKNHDDLDLYDGLVKPDSLSRLSMLEDALKRTSGNSSNIGVLSGITTVEPSSLTTCIPLSGNYSAFAPTTIVNATTDTLSGFEAAGYAAYSTALSVTIAIGCSLLILNVLIFAGVYYQRDKTRLEVKSLQKQYQQRGMHQQVPFDPIKHAHYHLGHSQSANVIVDVENHDASTILLSGDVKSPHICSNAMQISAGCGMPTKVPLADNVAYAGSGVGGGGSGGGGGGGGGKQQREHIAMKNTQTFGRNNTGNTGNSGGGTSGPGQHYNNSGVMTLPKASSMHHTTSLSYNRSGQGGGGGGVASVASDCMTLPRNINSSAHNNSSSGTTEAQPNKLQPNGSLLGVHHIRAPRPPIRTASISSPEPSSTICATSVSLQVQGHHGLGGKHSHSHQMQQQQQQQQDQLHSLNSSHLQQQLPQAAIDEMRV